jgi:hypothetical protein
MDAEKPDLPPFSIDMAEPRFLVWLSRVAGIGFLMFAAYIHGFREGAGIHVLGQGWGTASFVILGLALLLRRPVKRRGERSRDYVWLALGGVYAFCVVNWLRAAHLAN